MSRSERKKILIADDDISTLKDIISIFEDNPDYIFYTTGNGKSACEIASAEIPDLIIMDWQMPVMDGLEATMQLKQNETTKDIPIIISTGVMLEPTHLSKALLSGAVDYIRKPVDALELTARVSNMLTYSEAYSKIKVQNIQLKSQLTLELIHMQQLNELKMATTKQLTLLKQQTSFTNNQNIKETIISTERLLESKAYQIDWADFELYFELVHQGFFNNLKTRFGNFTPNELRLSAFLKLNMSSKEIASIIYTSPDSVDTARKRLKKKMRLLSTESLQSFIHNL